MTEAIHARDPQDLDLAATQYAASHAAKTIEVKTLTPNALLDALGEMDRALFEHLEFVATRSAISTILGLRDANDSPVLRVVQGTGARTLFGYPLKFVAELQDGAHVALTSSGTTYVLLKVAGLLDDARPTPDYATTSKRIDDAVMALRTALLAGGKDGRSRLTIYWPDGSLHMVIQRPGTPSQASPDAPVEAYEVTAVDNPDSI